MNPTRPAPRPRRAVASHRLVVAVLGVLAAFGILAAPALAAKPAKGNGHARIDVLSPKYESSVDSKTLDVRVRLSTTAGFRAGVAGNDVTKRFHRVGNVYEAKLRRGRDFDLGENGLLIAAGSGSARNATTVYFTARRADKGFLKVTELPAHGVAPLRFRIRTAAPVAWLKVTLNHHRNRVGPLAGRRAWTIAVGPQDKLHYGRNKLRVVAEREGKERYDYETLPFVIHRQIPLASAGPDRSTVTGRAVVLNAAGTQAGSGKGTLLYRWKIVQQPRGSHAKIVHPTRRKARLLPDLPGDYRVRLTAALASGKTLAQARAFETTATASATTTPEPVCLSNLPVALIPASSESGSTGSSTSARATGASESGESSESGEDSFDALEPPACVTPTGEETPPLPVAALQDAGTDESEVSAEPTGPMGWPIETIAANGAIKVGKQEWAKGSAEDFAQYVIFKDRGMEKATQGMVSLAKPEALNEAVGNAGVEATVVVSGMGIPHSSVPKAAVQSLSEALQNLNAKTSLETGELEAAIKTGNWSVVGELNQPGTYSNMHGATEQTPVEATNGAGSLPGSVNGHMQPVKANYYNFVSTEFVRIDTRAEPSTNTLNIFKVGKETISSTEIPHGALGLHIVVFNDQAPNAVFDAVQNNTYTIVNPGGGSNIAGVREAAEDIDNWRVWPGNDLIVMQTMGEEGLAKGTAPWGAQNWVNDALIPNSTDGLFEWNNKPFLNAKNPAEMEKVLNSLWNREYATVAGQVGDMTGSVGHDLVANFGLANANFKYGTPTYEDTHLTMVASNHVEDPESNYVHAEGEPFNVVEKTVKKKKKKYIETQAPFPGRTVGTLVRSPEGGLEVQNGVAGASFESSKIWELAYAEGTAWPDIETEEENKATEYITMRLLGQGTPYKSIRETYSTGSAAFWGNERTNIERLVFEPGHGFEKPVFEKLQTQLAAEAADIVPVKSAINEWKELIAKGEHAALIQGGTVGGKVIDEVIDDEKNIEQKEAEISPEAIISESLYTAAEIAGFPEVYEAVKIPEMIGIVAGGISLAEAASPEPADSQVDSTTGEIRNKVGLIGGNLATYLEGMTYGLDHLEAILVSDWGKLSQSATLAKTKWRLSNGAEELTRAISTQISREYYEALLPYAFEEWVLSPYTTEWNGAGPQLPPYQYQCHWYNESPGVHINHPFKSEPDGGFSAATYRPKDPPGNSIVPYTVRALKSTRDKMTMTRQEISELGTEIVSVNHDGSSPKADLIEPLFERTLTDESLSQPKRLGLNKTEFFARFGDGPTSWKRTICAQFNP